MIHTIHDLGYKYLFSNITIFRQLLETFVKEAWVKDLDFSDWLVIDKSFVSEQFKATECDMLYRIKYQDKKAYVFILMEFHSTVARFAALRLLNYITNFYMDYVRTHKKFKLLPPVFPLLLYNGKKPWSAPLELTNLIQDQSLFGKYALQFEYLPIIQNRFDPTELTQIANLVATLFFAETQSDQWKVTELFREMCDKENDLQAVSLLVNWFIQKKEARPDQTLDLQQLYHIYKSKEEVKTVLMETIEKEQARFIKIGEKRGEERGEKRGEKRGLMLTARAMLVRNYPIKEIIEITGLSEEEIQKLKEELC